MADSIDNDESKSSHSVIRNDLIGADRETESSVTSNNYRDSLNSPNSPYHNQEIHVPVNTIPDSEDRYVY